MQADTDSNVTNVHNPLLYTVGYLVGKLCDSEQRKTCTRHTMVTGRYLHTDSERIPWEDGECVKRKKVSS